MDQNWKATGLTCDHCAQSVTKNLMGIAGMENVSIEVHPEGQSSIATRGAREFSSEEISFAMRQAGRYILAK